MSNEENRTTKDSSLYLNTEDLKPPKLPIAGIVSTFVAPTLVVVLPYFFDAGKESLQTLVIIALVLLSVLLFVMFLTTYFRLYNESFASQVIQLKQAALSKRLDALEKNSNIVSLKIDALEKRESLIELSTINQSSDNHCNGCSKDTRDGN